MGTDLRGRVAQRAASGQQPGTDVAERNTKVVDLVRSMESQFQMAMPKGAEAAQLIRDVLTSISRTPNLRKCEPMTVVGASMTMAQLGLRPGVLGHGWILPFWHTKNQRHEAQLIIGYKGYLELISRSGRVSAPGAHAVHANDEFELGFTDGHRSFTHHVDWWSPRGDLLGWYAAAQERGAEFVTVTDPWSVTQMEEHRDRFAMARFKGEVIGPWKDHFDSMARKTMLLRLADMLPKSTEVQNALEADGKVRIDLSPEGIAHGETVIEGEVESDSFDGGEDPGADAPPPAPVAEAAAAKATQRQMNNIHRLLAGRGITSDEAVHSALADILSIEVTSRSQLTKDQAGEVIDHLEKLPPAGEQA